MALFDEHLEESKRLISELANKLLLNDSDLEADNRLLAIVHQKVENGILFDYLIDLANERLENFEVFISDEIEQEKYREELLNFLRTEFRMKV